MNRRLFSKELIGGILGFLGIKEVKAKEAKSYDIKLLHSNKACYYSLVDDIHVLHREDGPAVEHTNGDKHWYKNGLRHREDGPALERSNGDKHWYKNGLLHREDGPAMEYTNGDKHWYKNGLLHREDGPAVEYANGYKAWCKNGLLHREDVSFIEKTDLL